MGSSLSQLHTLIHELTRKGTLVGMDLVENAPGRDVGGTTMNGTSVMQRYWRIIEADKPHE